MLEHVKVDLALLAGPLPVTSSPGLANDDPELHKVTFHFSRGEYEDAARVATSLFTRRVYDVRLLAAFFVGAFLDTGVPGLAATLRALLPVLGENLAAFGPVKRRAELGDGALAALFRTLTQLLDYHDVQRDEAWTNWVLESDEEGVDEIVNACAAVGDAAAKVLPGGAGLDEIAKLRTWFDLTFRQIVERHSVLPELRADPPPAAIPAVKPAVKPASARKPTRPPPPIPAPAPAPEEAPEREPATLAQASDTLEIKVSPALKLLVQKLQAFEILMERGELQKAAVVAHDLEGVLAAFDPKVYLPGLLSSYFAVLSARVDDLSPYLDAPEGRGFQALQCFYQVDLDAFVKDPAR